MTAHIHRAVLSWREQGIALLPGLAVDDIRAHSTRAGVKLSADIELLYSLCGGMPTGTVDAQWFALWPLERMLQSAEKFPHSLLPFAEGFISAQLYCLRVEQTSTASVHMDYWFDGQTTQNVAPCLNTMCGLLLDNPSAMGLP